MAMDKQVLIVSLVGGFLGLLSVILGFTAEVTKITSSDVWLTTDYLYCVYPNSPAFGMAIGAVLLLVIAQIIVTAFGGCCGCCKRDPSVPAVTGNRRTLTIIFTVVSWITFAIAVILLILGADKNGQGGQTTSIDDCYVVKPGIFAGGAICALFTMSFSITAYILLAPSTDAGSKPTPGIAIGTPQYPQAQPQYPQPQPQYPGPGVGGSQYPAPGVGGSGTEYPAPGVGGTNYA